MITNVKGAQAACGTDAAGASTFGSATVVRLCNNAVSYTHLTLPTKRIV